MRRAAAAAAVAAVALLLAPGAFPRASADEVRMKDGRLLEGKVVSETTTEVTFRLRFGGDLVLPRSEIQAIERKDLPEEALAKARAALDPVDAEGRWALAQRAKEQRLKKAFEELLDEILRIDPGHAGANGARGNVLHEGRWMKPAERDRLVAEQEKAARAGQGLVEYRGRWVTPEEKEALEKGLVLRDGKWVSEAEAKAAEGLVPYRGGWVKREDLESIQFRDAIADAAGVKLTSASSPRFQVFTVFPQADTEVFLQDAEKAYASFAQTFDVKPADRLFDDPFNHRERVCTVVILEKEVQYQALIDALLRVHPDLKKVTQPGKVELWRRLRAFSVTDPDCWIVSAQFPYPREHVRHTVVHQLNHVMLQRWHNKGSAWTQWWLVEGLACVQEIDAFGSIQVFCITTGYGEKSPDEKAIGDSWKAAARQMVASGGDRGLRELCVLSLNDLTPLDLVKCWSFVHYLLALDRGKFVDLVLKLKGKGQRVDAAQVFAEVYGATPEQMDDRWRDFVRRTY